MSWPTTVQCKLQNKLCNICLPVSSRGCLSLEATPFDWDSGNLHAHHSNPEIATTDTRRECKNIGH